ncbi:thrombospondin type-1 domain-containing protein 4-like isoform X2 [Aphidius gifuensis]|uniref:thrombospondin type-1 domain-containing protein 4-like isoform X2 n=1 Tax=Aphidius gifuensis TaxID=684658 RepID=UPI001CDBDA1F|nr:thrombospondin type-1 domain-containing protein 4-like isoform X2 [Aphidius gifuensis]
MNYKFFICLVLYFLGLANVVDGHLIDGIFTEPTLEPGYNLVATIPTGATNINITELRHANNYLAIRLEDGNFLLNGNYSINWSGVYKAVGTSFVYHRQTHQQLESIGAIGPIQQSIDIMVLYQEPNPGIVYRYNVGGKDTVPTDATGQVVNHKKTDTTLLKAKRIDPTLITIDESTSSSPSPTRRIKKRKFNWKSSEFTICSKTCGGGVKSKNYYCVREQTQIQVPAKRCHGLEKPVDVPVRCNTGPCPPRWRAGSWSTCSVSCGSGIRLRELECVQEVNNLLTVRIADSACADIKTPSIKESCEISICKNIFVVTTETNLNKWITGDWSKCSTTCGLGKKTRKVSCIPDENSCPVNEKPIEYEECKLDACPNYQYNLIDTQKSQWLHSEWTKDCSTECGMGFQTRSVICDKDETCDVNSRPESIRTCSSDRACSGQWFIGPWTRCSSSCDIGEQTRDIICMTTIHGSLRVVLDMNCPPDKPDTKKSCNGPPCPPTWFTSDWTDCTKTCDTGLQTRHVKCFKRDDKDAECKHDDRPIGRRTCNEYPCKQQADITHDNEEKSKQIINDPDINQADESCKDTSVNCGLVIQARLCIYKFYEKICCYSCSKIEHDSN